jgi:hypothetical protein
MSSANMILAAAAWVVAGVAVAVAAALSGRPFWFWLVYAVAFWPLALAHLLFVKPRRPGASPLDDDL